MADVKLAKETTNNSIDLTKSVPLLKNLVADILEEAVSQGASAAEVSASEDVGLSVTVRKGELETVEFNQDRGFGITLYFGQRKGSASTSDSSPDAIAQTVRAAANIARYTQEDTCNGLAKPELMPESLVDLDLYHPWNTDAQAAEALALACEAAGLNHDSRIRNSDGAQVSIQQSSRVYGNSHGFIGHYLGTRHGMSCVLIAEDDNGMQRDHWYTTARDPALLETPEAVGEQAGRRSVARLSPRKVQTGHFPVLFCPQMSSGLVSHFLGAISGGSLYRKASFLMDSLGCSVMSDHLNLVEEPHLPKHIGSAGFDSDGVATRDKAFVTGGIVANYVLSSYSARRLGMETTGNAGGVFNVTLKGNEKPFTELLKTMGEGLYVTELMGQGVNGVTGDYSRGATGFWVENGELAYPVEGLTIASNLKDMLQDIQYLGDDYDLRGNIRTPSVLVGEMTVASN
ncbi:MAG: metalloprotease PmbA [Gammaproteobacteria bacterium]|nr:metalloprotease PmbA [Gammaproteobacteria bacterium]